MSPRIALQSTLIVVLSCFAIASLIAPASAAQQPPADSIQAIILPAAPDPAERHAADDLAAYLQKITAVAPAIVGEDQPRPPGRAIILGRTQSNLKDHDPDSWARDTIYIGYGPGDIAIIGQGPQGTLFAAYEFLRDQGCRWYFPDNIDEEIVPRHPSLIIPGQPRQHTPPFSQRGWHGPPVSPRAFEVHLRPWCVRNGINAMLGGGLVDFGPEFGHGLRLRGSHTIWVLIPSADFEGAQETFAAHPDWYPLVNGKRVMQYKDGRPVQACISNPQVVQEVARKVIEFFRENPGYEQFSVSESDEPTWSCECDNCRAMDGPNSKWKANDLWDAYAFKSKVGPGPLSTRWVKFVNEVAKIVAKEYPTKRITFYAYGSTVAPPTDPAWTLEKNVTVEYAFGDGWCMKHAPDDPSCPVNAAMLGWAKQWSSHGNPLLFYDYPPNGGKFDIPSGFTKSYKPLILALKNAGVSGFSGEGQGSWAGSALWQYLKARLLWDIDQDPDALIAEFCRDLYGPAAEPMRAYYLTFDEELRKLPDHVVWGNWVTLMSDGLVDKLSDLIAQAEKLTAAEAPALRRVEMVRVSLNALRLARMAEQIDKARDPEALDRYNDLRKQTLELIEKYPVPVTDTWRDQLGKSVYRPPFEAMQGQQVLALPTVWKFRTDPKDEGTKAGWDKSPADPDAWRDIDVTKSWTDQGVDYHGIAWYATRIEVPKGADGELWLLFDAIDGESELFVDGKSAGKLPIDPWDKPKAFKVTELAKPGQPHYVALRVVKNTAAAGITGAVKLMAAKQ